MSPFLTGPLTFLTRVLFTAPVNCTLTWVIPPLEPTHKHAQLDTTGIRTGCDDSETSEASQARDDDPDSLIHVCSQVGGQRHLPVLPMISSTTAYTISPESMLSRKLSWSNN